MAKAIRYCALILLVLTPILALSNPSEVAPGGVVRWPGQGISECSTGERSWAPVAGACWYPADLLMDTGSWQLSRVREGQTETSIVMVSAYPYPVQELEVEPRMVDLAADDLARAQRETQRIKALWDQPGEVRFTLPLGAPLAELSAPSSFGSRRIFNGQPRNPHTGVDFKAARGTEVLSVAEGVVVLAEEHYFAGNSVFVNHGGGLISMYFHLDRIDVEKGQEVDRGQTLGLVGATGRSTGPHLHYGLRWHGARIDPVPMMGKVEAFPVVSDD